MPHTFRSMLIPAADRDLARQIWGTLDPEYANTFRFPCTSASDPDSKDITHYCDAGPITDAAALLMPLEYWIQDPDTGAWTLEYRDDGNPKRVQWFCKNQGFDVPLPDVENIWRHASVSEQDLNRALERMNLRILWPEESTQESTQEPAQDSESESEMLQSNGSDI